MYKRDSMNRYTFQMIRTLIRCKSLAQIIHSYMYIFVMDEVKISEQDQANNDRTSNFEAILFPKGEHPCIFHKDKLHHREIEIV